MRVWRRRKGDKGRGREREGGVKICILPEAPSFTPLPSSSLPPLLKGFSELSTGALTRET